MDSSKLVALIGGVVGLVGGVAGLLSWFNQREQTTATKGQLAVMQSQVESSKRREEADIDWARRFDEAAQALAKISPSMLTTAPNNVMQAYKYVFSDAEVRRRIETYLGKRTWWSDRFVPNVLSKEQLQNAVIQQTITEVLNIVGKFKVEHNDFARTLKLL